MKSKRKTVIIFVTVLMIVILTVVLYPQIGKSVIEKSIYELLLQDGYTASDISHVEVRHSYIGGSLGYGQWHTSIYFTDEPKVEYHCILSDGVIPRATAIRAGGFSSDLPDDYEPLHYPS